jgi:hypothetical protein
MSRRWKTLIGVAGLLAVLLAINTLVVEGETKSAAMTVPGGRILHLPGGDMQVLEKGPRHAPPIVLLHCYTCSIVWWQQMIPLLDRDRRVLAVDLRGFGGSEKFSGRLRQSLFNRMTYTSYDSDGKEGDYMDAEPLDRRIARTGTRCWRSLAPKRRSTNRKTPWPPTRRCPARRPS